MMNKVVFIFFIYLQSCSNFSKNNFIEKFTEKNNQFTYTDRNGNFLLNLSSGMNKKDKSFFTKKNLHALNENVSLEKTIALSELGKVSDEAVILRPKVSQYTIWLEGKKYFSEIKLNKTSKSFDVKIEGDETKWTGTKSFKLLNSKSNYCFFSQIIECATASGFISKSIKAKDGVMKFFVVWESFPFMGETISDFPSELFSKAEFEYDGPTKEEELRFNLNVGGQSIFFLLNKDLKLNKILWVSQGISVIKK